MSTNYYMYENYCVHCGRGDAVHIGKSSGGWHFSLCVYPDKNINSLEDWKKIFDTGVIIKDEYDKVISKEELLDIITNRSWNRGRVISQEFLDDNHADVGLNGLVRHRIDGLRYGNGCIGHGEGTWDYIVGEFS